MNKVYYGEVDSDYGGVFVAAKNSKEARRIAWREEPISYYACYKNAFINFTVERQEKNGKPITTELSGAITVEQAQALGIDVYYLK